MSEKRTDKTKIYFYQSDKRNCPRTKALPSSVKHGSGCFTDEGDVLVLGGGCYCLGMYAATGVGSLVFIDNVG